MDKRRILVLLVAFLATAYTAGCSTGFVNEAARTSMASFLTDVFSTAVNETVGP